MASLGKKLAVPLPNSSALQEIQYLLVESVPQNKFEPKLIGWFTKDEEGGFRGEDTNFLKYLHLPRNLSNVHFDLSHFNDDDQFNFPIYEPENIDPLLYWIKANSSDEKGLPKK